jgi:hypothetical protein
LLNCKILSFISKHICSKGADYVSTDWTMNIASMVNGLFCGCIVQNMCHVLYALWTLVNYYIWTIKFHFDLSHISDNIIVCFLQVLKIHSFIISYHIFPTFYKFVSLEKILVLHTFTWHISDNINICCKSSKYTTSYFHITYFLHFTNLLHLEKTLVL